MATYRVEFRKSADKDVTRIAARDIPRILSAVEALKEDQHPPGSKKLTGGEHTYRIRVGDYRVVYSLLADSNLVVVERVRHRRDVYRDLPR